MVGQAREENRDPRDNNVRPRLAGNWRVGDRKKLEGVTFVTVSHSHHTWHTCANSLVYHVENLYPQSQVSSWSQTHMSHLDSPKSLACSDLVAAFYHDFRCVCVCAEVRSSLWYSSLLSLLFETGYFVLEPDH